MLCWQRARRAEVVGSLALVLAVTEAAWNGLPLCLVWPGFASIWDGHVLGMWLSCAVWPRECERWLRDEVAAWSLGFAYCSVLQNVFEVKGEGKWILLLLCCLVQGKEAVVCLLEVVLLTKLVSVMLVKSQMSEVEQTRASVVLVCSERGSICLLQVMLEKLLRQKASVLSS